jgi:hypothetical protein
MENELQWIYKMYVEVDEQGNIIDSLSGSNAVPLKKYQFFFLDTAFVDTQEYALNVISENLYKLKIEVRNFTPIFILKDVNETIITEMPPVAELGDGPIETV